MVVGIQYMYEEQHTARWHNVHRHIRTIYTRENKPWIVLTDWAIYMAAVCTKSSFATYVSRKRAFCAVYTSSSQLTISQSAAYFPPYKRPYCRTWLPTSPLPWRDYSKILYICVKVRPPCLEFSKQDGHGLGWLWIQTDWLTGLNNAPNMVTNATKRVALATTVKLPWELNWLYFIFTRPFISRWWMWLHFFFPISSPD